MIWRPFFPLEARVFLFSAEGMRGWTSVWALVWRVRRPWRGAEAGAPVTRAEHAVACASVSMDSTLLWGHRVASPCVKGRMQPERISCAQRFHAPCGHRMGRRKCCPHQLSLFSFCMRKEGEGREIPCSCLVCWRNWKWVCLVLESNIAWTLCSEELWRGWGQRTELVAFFVQAANLRYFSLEKLCELRLFLDFLTTFPSSHILSCQCGSSDTGAGRSWWWLPPESQGREGVRRHFWKGAWPSSYTAAWFSF